MINEISFLSEGVPLKGTFYDVNSKIEETPLVVVLTGDSPKGTKTDTWIPVIKTLTDSEISVFIFDFHSQGLSEGERSELTLSKASINFRDALSVLIKNYNLDSRNIGVFGSSFGGSVVLNSIDYISNFKAIGLKSPASFLAEAYEAEHRPFEEMDKWRKSKISHITGLNYMAYIDAINHNLYRNLSLIKCPVLIVHGDSDSIVPIEQSRRLAHLIGSHANLVEIKGADHNYKQEGAMEILLEKIIFFFNTNLK